MQNRVINNDVVLAKRIRRIDTQRIVCTGMTDRNGAQLTILTGQAVGPVPLPGQHLNFYRVIWRGHDLPPNDKTGSEQGRHTHRG